MIYARYAPTLSNENLILLLAAESAFMEKPAVCRLGRQAGTCFFRLGFSGDRRGVALQQSAVSSQ